MSTPDSVEKFDIAYLVLSGTTTAACSNTIAPVKLVRDLGLAAVNRMPPLKRLLMQHAMGALGDQPRLARGERL